MPGVTKLYASPGVLSHMNNKRFLAVLEMTFLLVFIQALLLLPMELIETIINRMESISKS